LIKQAFESVAHSAAFSKFVSLLEGASVRNDHLLRVLTYHRVDRTDADALLAPGLISATPEAFEEQLFYLKTNYNPVSIADLLAAYENRCKLPSFSVMVTFDDAYRNFAEHAWPILKRQGVPVTLFVPTGYPDHPERTFWWDRLHQALATIAGQEVVLTPLGSLPVGTANQRVKAYKLLRNYVKFLPHEKAMAWVEDFCGRLNLSPAENPVLGWNALRQLAQEGVTLGAHTRSHPLLNRIPLSEVEAEVRGSLEDLQREVGTVAPIFSYPSGGFDEQVIQVVKACGITLAFTTDNGLNDLRNINWLRIRRINISQRAPLAVLRVRLLPVWTYLNADGVVSR
jgi:peptidoglycan/xylan/chitin deacetylase (PgdA/CDA1 family)